jgi:GH15 family glucan-1,4-alpha-glucosidase
VRIGNAAHGQLQLDVYGEVIDALHQGRRGGLRPSAADWPFQRALIEHVESIWKEPDAGMWEVRGALKHFTYSKVMTWVALDRGIRAAEASRLKAPTARWRRVRDAIHAEICARGFNRELGSFVQSFESTELDASLLLLPAVGFLPASDERIKSTIDAIERRLMVDGFVARYDTTTTDDGLPPGEGTFLACSFWLADAYAMSGRVEEARAVFERLIALANDVGLLAEEYDPKDRRLLGNFPQACSHIALVNTAHNLARMTKPNEQRSSS